MNPVDRFLADFKAAYPPKERDRLYLDCRTRLVRDPQTGEIMGHLSCGGRFVGTHRGLEEALESEGFKVAGEIG